MVIEHYETEAGLHDTYKELFETDMIGFPGTGSPETFVVKVTAGA